MSIIGQYTYCQEKSIKHLILSKLTSYHFQLIHPAPQQYWTQLVQSTIEQKLPTPEIEENVKGIKSIERDLQDFLQNMQKS